MGFALESVADREWGVFRGRQSIGHGELRANVATGIALHLGVIFEPEQEAFFELATERLLERGNRAHLEAGDPSRNGATRNFEKVDAFDSRCNHESPSDKSSGREQIGWLNQSRDKDHNLHLPEEVY